MSKSTHKVKRKCLLMSGVQIDSELNYKYRRINSNRILDDSDIIILACADTAAITVTLPDASNADGRLYNIKKIDSSASTITVDGAGSETIDENTTISLMAQNESVTIMSDSTNWWIL